MRRPLLLLVLAAGCAKSTPAPPTTVDAGVATSGADATAPLGPQAAARHAVAQWNAAHDAHDAAALEKLYAARVTLFDTPMSSADAAKNKAATFAAAPDFKQIAGVPVLETSDDGRETYARFTKTTTANTKTVDTPVLLVVDAAGKIVEEADDATQNDDWCFTRTAPGKPDWNHRIVPPFRMSAADVVPAALASKHVAALRVRVRHLGVSPDRFSCAKRCPGTSRKCFFAFRLDDLDVVSDASAVEWLWVDPIAKELSWKTHDDAGAIAFAIEPL